MTCLSLFVAWSASGATPATGPLRVNRENPRYFTDGARMSDGSLKAIYLTGSHHWNNFQDSAKLGKPLADEFDYRGLLETAGGTPSQPYPDVVLGSRRK